MLVKTLKSIACILLFFAFLPLMAQKSSEAENIFKKYLEKEETTVAKIIVNINDSLYSEYCKAILADNLSKKRTHFFRFISLDPPYGVARAFYNLGLSYAQANKLDSALFYYNISLRKDSTYLYSYYHRGELYSMFEQHQKAISDFNMVIKMSPSFANAYLLRGNSYLAIKDYPNALADFNKTIEFDAYSDQAYLMRGVVYREQKDYLIAIENWKQAKKISSLNDEVADQLIQEVRNLIKDEKKKK